MATLYSPKRWNIINERYIDKIAKTEHTSFLTLKLKFTNVLINVAKPQNINAAGTDNIPP